MRRLPAPALFLAPALVLFLALALPARTLAETPLLPLPFAPDPATRQISVTVDRGLTRTAALPTPALRQARRDLLAKKPLSDADLRALADRRDGLAAQVLVRRLVARIEASGAADAATRSDIAYYGSLAVASGRVWTLPQTVAAMATLDPATEPRDRVKAYVAMLYPHAWAGNSLALDALIALNGEGRLFGPMSDKTRARLLEADAGPGGGRVALQLAVAALRDPADPVTARACLEQARASSHLAIRTMAETLLARLDAGGATGTGATRTEATQ